MDLGDLREDFEATGMRRRDLDPDPIVQFGRWFAEAEVSGIWEPHAVVVSTVGDDGSPEGRTVLLRGHDEHGFAFYTNYRSDKGRALAVNDRAALTFHWDQLRRQVRIGGTAQQLSAEQSNEYFSGRPRGSQLAAWASDQSMVVADRGELEARFADEEARWDGQPVDRPPHWGGYRVVPDRIEFWQGRQNRLHDRFRYSRVADGWTIDRLAP